MRSSSSRPLRIALGNICTEQWIAGCHYLRNLCVALKATAESPAVILYGSSSDNSKDLLAGVVDDALVSPIHRIRPIHSGILIRRGERLSTASQAFLDFLRPRGGKRSRERHRTPNG